MERNDFRKIRAIYRRPDAGADSAEYRPTLEQLRNELKLQANIGSVGDLLDAVFDRLLNPTNEIPPDTLPINLAATKELIRYLDQTPAREGFLPAFLVVGFLASVVVEVNDSGFDILDDAFEQTSKTQVLFLREVASYASFRTAEEVYSSETSTLVKQLENLMENYRIRLSEVESDIARARAELNGLVGEARDHVGALRADADGIKAAVEQLKTETSTSEGNLTAFRTAVSLDMRLKTAADHWNSRAGWNTAAFIFSLLVLAVIFVGGPLLGYSYREEIQIFFSDQARRVIEELCPALQPGDKCEPLATQLAIVSLNRLVAIAVPLLLFFWLIKLLVRYNLHALVMGNDARQRSTMIKSFLYLADQGVVKKEDKTELLTAIFRPPPGTTGETIEVPNVVEVINKMR